ncbi:MAG: glycosyltransferase [Coriobacteriia bacterium]
MFGIFVAEQVASTKKRGIAVDVLFINGLASKLAYLRGVGQVRAAVRSGAYDLIHAHYVFSAVVALGQRRLPVLVTHHGIETQIGWTAPLCRWVSRHAARTIATSRRVQEALRRPDVDILPCGVDTDLFHPGPRGAARERLGLDTDAPLVLFAGMRRPEKRFELIEGAIAELRSRRPEVQLVIAESEPHHKMPDFMNACDVLILTSRAEGSPMVIKEAMACNLPIVSVDVGDVAEVIDGIRGCFVVEPKPSALAGALDEALGLGSRTQGRQAILPVSLDAVAERLDAIYREMTAVGAGSTPFDKRQAIT